MAEEDDPVPGEVPRAAAILGLFVLALFAPALLDGRVLAPAGDGTLYYYPLRVYVSEHLARGSAPLWNPSIFDGFPLLADSEAGVFYPPNLLFLVLPAPLAMNVVVLSSFWLAALFTFLYARTVGASFSGALLAGMAFGGGGFLVTRLAHTTIVNGAAWFPLLLWFLERLRQRVSRGRIAGAALAAALPVLAGHPQVAFYSLMSAVLYLAYFASSGFPRRSGALPDSEECLLGLSCRLLDPAHRGTGPSEQSPRPTYESFGDPALPPAADVDPERLRGPGGRPVLARTAGMEPQRSCRLRRSRPRPLRRLLPARRPHVRFWLAYGLVAC
jgi:hypothetical protein